MAVFCEVIIIIIDHCLDWLLIYWFMWHRNFTSSSLCPLQIRTKSGRHSFDDLLMPESKCIDQLPSLWSYIYCSFMSLKWNILTYFLTAYYHLEQLVIGYSTKKYHSNRYQSKEKPWHILPLFITVRWSRNWSSLIYPPYPTRDFLVGVLKSSCSNWTKLYMMGSQLSSGWCQMISDVP